MSPSTFWSNDALCAVLWSKKFCNSKRFPSKIFCMIFPPILDSHVWTFSLVICHVPISDWSKSSVCILLTDHGICLMAVYVTTIYSTNSPNWHSDYILSMVPTFGPPLFCVGRRLWLRDCLDLCQWWCCCLVLLASLKSNTVYCKVWSLLNCNTVILCCFSSMIVGRMMTLWLFYSTKNK